MKKLVIFDLDGTLLNTIDDLGIATNHALRQLGYPEHSMSSYPLFVGNGVTRLLERAMPEDARSQQNIAEMRALFTEYYDEHCADHSRPYQGIPELLENLTEAGVKVAVASNKYHEAVVKLINHFFPDIPWACVRGHREGMPVKPDPSIVFDILSEVPTRKDDVLYVGDSGIDMETARRACIDSCGVTWGFRSARELRQGLATHIVTLPLAIMPIVEVPDGMRPMSL